MHCFWKRSLIVFCILLSSCLEGQQSIAAAAPNILASDIAEATTQPDDEDVIAVTSIESNAVGSGEPDLASILPGDEEVPITTTEGNLDIVTDVTVSICEKDCDAQPSSQCLCDCNTSEVLDQCVEQSTEQSTEQNTEQHATSTESDITDSLEPDAESSTAMPTQPSKTCSSAGELVPHEGNCHVYTLCSPQMEALTQTCPEGTAFNAILRRCARDLAGCQDEDPPCTISGTFADGQSNDTYMWCVPHVSGGGWHKYRVHCTTYETFLPALGTCFFDLEKLQSVKPNFNQPDDMDVIKVELQEFKIMEKAREKEQKLKLKLEKKLAKALAKKAVKEAKERAKLEGKDSMELEGFVCTEEGNFASPLGPNFYNNCASKKGKLKAETMVCPSSQIFDQLTSQCA